MAPVDCSDIERRSLDGPDAIVEGPSVQAVTITDTDASAEIKGVRSKVGVGLC